MPTTSHIVDLAIFACLIFCEFLVLELFPQFRFVNFHFSLARQDKDKTRQSLFPKPKLWYRVKAW